MKCDQLFGGLSSYYVGMAGIVRTLVTTFMEFRV